ncbi:hypothetical protein A8950_2296 [Dongia mobilis]|uniref:Uncharacterized protein n=1 Tax=Dongia mobilis TaxID=578943 RepID=A0A4R6WNG8_9PROT|nr:DUF721 domain-containing protein [Dongia mobilis]TDQ82473.1 hypothetical protein A8950_2296 [Dongia mobilis]
MAEPAPRRARLAALAQNVPALARLALGKRGFAEADLISQWPAIVGPELAALAMPVKLRLKRPRKEAAMDQTGGISPALPANVAGGTLTLRASAAASLEVQHLKPQILARIATYFGYPAISDIRIEIGDRRSGAVGRRRPAPALTCAAPPDLSGVGDPELRAALQRLGAARRLRG